VQTAINLEGRGVISHNVVWGNVRENAFQVEGSEVHDEEEVPPPLPLPHAPTFSALLLSVIANVSCPDKSLRCNLVT